MRYELSERVYTKRDEREVLDVILRHFKRIAEASKVSDREVVVSKINANFGSIVRSDQIKINVEKIAGGFEIISDVRYNPSIFFWIFSFFGIFLYGIGWLIPVMSYYWHRKIVKNAVSDTLTRISDSFNHDSNAPYTDFQKESGASSTDDLIKLAALRDRGYITEEEFSAQKRRLIGSS